MNGFVAFGCLLYEWFEGSECSVRLSLHNCGSTCHTVALHVVNLAALAYCFSVCTQLSTLMCSQYPQDWVDKLTMSYISQTALLSDCAS